MGREVLSGDLFVFISKDRKRIKVLHFDGTGLIVWVEVVCGG
jgi:transposase